MPVTLVPIQQSTLAKSPDLVDLSEITDDSLLFTVRSRYKESIYTQIGQKALVQVNPCKKLARVFDSRKAA